MEKTGNTYEELVQLKESGEIGWREFMNDLDMNEDTAEAFMTLTEEHVVA